MTNMFANFSCENIAYWTKRAPGYSDVNQEELRTGQHRLWRETLDGRIRAHFQNRQRDEIRILDIGTGPGFFAIILAELGYGVTAIDYTQAMLEHARQNAGKLAEKIDFRCMNAEELSFLDGSFDVIVSRNLTWNLAAPDRAYAQWARVLKKGGLLLNFDANWYRYLFDAEAGEGHRRDRSNVLESKAADDTAGTDVTAMEAIARKVPLSAQSRPLWDLKTLGKLGLEARADENIWQHVWTENERINNSSTPMFLVYATKSVCGGERDLLRE